MEPVFAIFAGLLAAVAVVLLFSASRLRVLLGLTVLVQAVNFTVFAAGRLSGHAPAATSGGATLAQLTAGSLPHAIVLTVLVLAFGFCGLLLVLIVRSDERPRTPEARGGKAPGAAVRPPEFEL